MRTLQTWGWILAGCLPVARSAIDAGALVQKGVSRREAAAAGLNKFRDEMFRAADEAARNKTRQVADQFMKFPRVRRTYFAEPEGPPLSLQNITDMSDLTTSLLEKTAVARGSDRACQKACKISIGVDILVWVLMIFGVQCGPLTMVVFYVLGLMVCLEDEHLDFPDAMLLLGQMSTTVGYGSRSFGDSPTELRGLKLWHSLHSWLGVVVVNAMWDHSIDPWLNGILLTASTLWHVDSKFLAVLMLVVMLSLSAIIYSFDQESVKAACVEKLDAVNSALFPEGTFANGYLPAAAFSTMESKIENLATELGVDMDHNGDGGVLDIALAEGGWESLCDGATIASRLDLTSYGFPVVDEVAHSCSGESCKNEAYYEKHQEWSDSATTVSFKLFETAEGETMPATEQSAYVDGQPHVWDVRDLDDPTVMSGTITCQGQIEDPGYCAEGDERGPCTYSDGDKTFEVKGACAHGWFNNSKWDIPRYEFRHGAQAVVTKVWVTVVTGVKGFIYDVFDAMYMCAMSFSSVGYGDLSPATDWGKILSPIMMQLGTKFFNNVGAAIAENDMNELYKYDPPGKMFMDWYSSCIPSGMRATEYPRIKIKD